MSIDNYSRVKGKNGLFKLIFICMSFANIDAIAATYWVAPNGINSNPCSESLPCASVQFGVNKLFAGDTLNVKAGTYFETNIDGVSFFQHPVAINVPRSGTSASPITIQAAPGDEGDVIIDLQGSYAGFHLGGHQDYVHIKNLNIHNAYVVAINVPDSGSETSYNETALWSIGLVVEGNKIIDTYGAGAGNNSSAIRIYHVRDSIIRNNTVDRVGTAGLVDQQSHNTCVISYGLWNITIENNLFSRCGAGAIYWKAQAKDLPQVGYQSIIRFNKFTDNFSVVTNGDIGRGNGTHKILISNNIFENYYLGIDFKSSNSINAIVSHNFFNGAGSRTPASQAIVIRSELNSFQGSIFGNIYHSNEAFVYDFRLPSEVINQIDYNIFTSEPTSVLYTYQPNSLATYTLDQWQGIVNESILPNNPDANSELSSVSTMAVKLLLQDYRLPSGSMGVNFMPNGDNVGPYQKGNEVIGPMSCVNCDISANPNAPTSFSVSIQN